MRTYIWVRGRLRDIQQYLNCDDGHFCVVRRDVNDVGRLRVLRHYPYRTIYIPMSRIVFGSDLTDDLRRLIVD